MKKLSIALILITIAHHSSLFCSRTHQEHQTRNQYALRVAVSKLQNDVVASLLTAGVPVGTDAESALMVLSKKPSFFQNETEERIRSIGSQLIITVKEELKKEGRSLTESESETCNWPLGKMALFSAIEYGCVPLISLLAQQGVPVNNPVDAYWNSLFAAASQQLADVVSRSSDDEQGCADRLYVRTDSGCSDEPTDIGGRTMLALIDAGINIHEIKNGREALEVAISNNNFSAAKVLLAAHALLKEKDVLYLLQEAPAFNNFISFALACQQLRNQTMLADNINNHQMLTSLQPAITKIKEDLPRNPLYAQFFTQK